MRDIVKNRMPNYLAKVYKEYENGNVVIKTETVKEHTQQLLNRLDFLYQNNYINKECYDKLKIIAINHDIGKCNDQMNER